MVVLPLRRMGLTVLQANATTFHMRLEDTKTITKKEWRFKTMSK